MIHEWIRVLFYIYFNNWLNVISYHLSTMSWYNIDIIRRFIDDQWHSFTQKRAYTSLRRSMNFGRFFQSSIVVHCKARAFTQTNNKNLFQLACFAHLNKLLKPKRQQQQHPILNLWNMIELPKYVSCDSVHFHTSLVALGSALPYL